MSLVEQAQFVEGRHGLVIPIIEVSDKPGQDILRFFHELWQSNGARLPRWTGGQVNEVIDRVVPPAPGSSEQATFLRAHVFHRSQNQIDCDNQSRIFSSRTGSTVRSTESHAIRLAPATLGEFVNILEVDATTYARPPHDPSQAEPVAKFYDMYPITKPEHAQKALDYAVESLS